MVTPWHQIRSRDAVVVSGGLSLCGVAGALAAVAPQALLVLAIACAYILLALGQRQVLVVISIAAVAFTPQSLFAGVPLLSSTELQKALIYLGLIPLLIERGVVWRLTPALVAYPLVAVLIEVLGSPSEALTVSQTLSSLLTLCIAWTAAAVAWQWPRDAWLLKVLAATPLFIVAIGVGLAGAGIRPLFSADDGVHRLQATMFSAHLALFAVAAAAAALMLVKTTSWRWSQRLVWINSAVVAATLTRGALIALAIALTPVVFGYVRRTLAHGSIIHVLRVVCAAGVLVTATVTLLPSFQARDQQKSYSEERGFYRDPSSGRLEAWSEYLTIANQQPVLGHGIGAGPITQIDRVGFEAQHNEYLRAYLEAGGIGGLMLLAAVCATCGAALRRVAPSARSTLISFYVSTAVWSFTDNTLTAVQYALPFGLIVGLMAASGVAASGRRALATSDGDAQPVEQAWVPN